MNTTQTCRQIACTLFVLLLALDIVNAQAPPSQDFSNYWRQHFRQDMIALDSLILTQANGGDTGENRLGKRIKKNV